MPFSGFKSKIMLITLKLQLNYSVNFIFYFFFFYFVRLMRVANYYRNKISDT